MEAWTGVYVASMILVMKFCRGEIRCYCNDASCISKGYMCKSSLLDRCFSLLPPDGATNFRPFHGCAELLSGRLATACGAQPEVDYVEHDATGSGVSDHIRSRVVCCTDDMCNYHADGYVVPVGSARVSNGTMQAHKTSSSDKKGPERRHTPRPGHHPTAVHEDGALRRDIWFRAAVIAVPIAGLVVLLLLILLAVRLLRAEHVTKSSTNHSLSRILKSPPMTNHTHVAIANDRGDVRTLLTPSDESGNVYVTVADGECVRTEFFWTDKEFKFTPEASKVLRDFETCSPSSECSKSSLNCKCCCLARDDVALTEKSTDAIV